eukprot:768459-Hanusia_phi.AAC.16
MLPSRLAHHGHGFGGAPLILHGLPIVSDARPPSSSSPTGSSYFVIPGQTFHPVPFTSGRISPASQPTGSQSVQPTSITASAANAGWVQVAPKSAASAKKEPLPNLPHDASAIAEQLNVEVQTMIQQVSSMKSVLENVQKMHAGQWNPHYD